MTVFGFRVSIECSVVSQSAWDCGLGVSHPHMNVLCHDHATDHGLDRRNPHEAAIRLLALKTDHLQFLPFEHQAVALQHIRHDGFGRHVGAHFRAPERQFAVDGVLDVINGRPGSEHLGVGECRVRVSRPK
jgi:hypothetical protein